MTSTPNIFAVVLIVFGCGAENTSSEPQAVANEAEVVVVESVQLGTGESFIDRLDGGSEILRAVRAGNVSRVRAMVADDSTLLETPGHMGRLPLHIAAEGGDVDMLQTLITLGANVDGRRERRDTPLFWSSNAETAEALLAAGAQIHATDFAHREPVHWAAQFSRADVVSLLLQRGAEANLADGSGNTPLHWAVREVTDDRPIAVVRALLAAGANANARNRDGETPLHLAVRIPENLDQRLFSGERKYAPEVPQAMQQITLLLLQHDGNPRISNRAGETPIQQASPVIRELINGRSQSSPRR